MLNPNRSIQTIQSWSAVISVIIQFMIKFKHIFFSISSHGTIIIFYNNHYFLVKWIVLFCILIIIL